MLFSVPCIQSLTTRSSEQRLAVESVPCLSLFSPASVAELGAVRRCYAPRDIAVMRVPPIDIPSLRFTVVILTAQPAFQQWLHASGLPSDEVYFPEEDPVWLIPPLGQFDSQAHADGYIEALKPHWLAHACGAFGVVPPAPCNSAAFDSFFHVSLRDQAFDAQTLSPEPRIA